MRIKELACRDSTLIACVGNYLRMDDGAGLEVCRGLKEAGVKGFISCEYGLENCLDLITRECPRRLIIIDAVLPKDPGRARAGDVIIARSEDVVNEVLVSTHNIPVNILIKYLRSYGCCSEVYVVGVVAKKLGFGEGLSKEVRESVKALTSELIEALRKCGSNHVGGGGSHSDYQHDDRRY